MKLYKTLTTSVEAVEGYDFHLTARAYALPHEHDGLKARAVSYIDDNPVAAALERASTRALKITRYLKVGAA